MKENDNEIVLVDTKLKRPQTAAVRKNVDMNIYRDQDEEPIKGSDLKAKESDEHTEVI